MLQADVVPAVTPSEANFTAVGQVEGDLGCLDRELQSHYGVREGSAKRQRFGFSPCPDEGVGSGVAWGRPGEALPADRGEKRKRDRSASKGKDTKKTERRDRSPKASASSDKVQMGLMAPEFDKVRSKKDKKKKRKSEKKKKSKKHRKRSSSSSSNSSSPSSKSSSGSSVFCEATDPKGALWPDFAERARLYPGRLSSEMLPKWNNVVGREGEELGTSKKRAPACAKSYYLKVITGMIPPHQKRDRREAYTLCTILDHLALGRFLGLVGFGFFALVRFAPFRASQSVISCPVRCRFARFRFLGGLVQSRFCFSVLSCCFSRVAVLLCGCCCLFVSCCAESCHDFPCFA